MTCTSAEPRPTARSFADCSTSSTPLFLFAQKTVDFSLHGLEAFLLPFRHCFSLFDEALDQRPEAPQGSEMQLCANRCARLKEAASVAVVDEASERRDSSRIQNERPWVPTNKSALDLQIVIRHDPVTRTCCSTFGHGSGLR